ncbi:SUMF1/EgtB/PvdO family nonheme iron enzyme [Chloroflexales bacterium ZM16-3]|nr:SUMF1/EgtB/PvdO family nonheme iron enzyme [Chloroflexales bacterium ZM16-3]
MSDIAAKIAELEAQIAALRAGVSQGMEAQTITNASQTTVLGDQHIHEAPPDEAHARAERALNGYLRAISHSCNTVQLARIDPRDGRHHAEMRLEQVYIDLYSERERELSHEEHFERERHKLGVQLQLFPVGRIHMLEALDRPHPARVLLLGGPGSGKSTFVNHLALCLAGACLGERDPADATHGAALLARLAPHWSHGALLPVRVVLRELAAFPALRNASVGSLALLHEFLGHTIAPHAEAMDLIVEALSAGRALLLFDGLDEVEAGPNLVHVSECISAAAGVYTRSPVLVTCRVLDYQANPQRQIPGFQIESLAPLNDDQINAFVDAWHAEVAATGRTMLGDAAGLRQALASSADLRDMARQPLLLTMMAIVHAGKGRLPDARALLYSECIELLLLRWRKEPDEPDLLSQLGLPDFKEPDLIKVMARIGFAAHNRSAQQPEEAAQPADLSRNAVRDELDAAFTYYQPDEERRAALVVRLLNAIATRNGLLLKQSGEAGEVYTFPHRSFQEFLAGYYISLQGDFDLLVWDRAGQVGWHESLRLMVSYQALTQASLGPALQVIHNLLRDGAPLEQALAGELLAMVGYARAANYHSKWAGPNGWWANACATLRAVSIAPSDVADAPLRARAGMALGQLCYGSLESLAQLGVTPVAHDPRLLDPATGDSPDGGYWCSIESGLFWYGDDFEADDEEDSGEDVDDEEDSGEDVDEEDKNERDEESVDHHMTLRVKEPLQQKSLQYDFEIARHPVTNAEYARFIAVGGYHDQRWWTNEGWRYIEPGGYRAKDESERIILPRFWGNPDLNSPLQPVVGVSWYEAAAYCIWLNERGHTEGWLPQEEEIRLPTSLEWERAARGDDQRHYPWGDDIPTVERANYAETALGTTSPIGCFPTGAAVCGAEDMAGNVYEWMCSVNEQPKRAQKDFTPGNRVLLSGSTFWCESEYLSCGLRFDSNLFPSIWDRGMSFRILWSPRST